MRSCVIVAVSLSLVCAHEYSFIGQLGIELRERKIMRIKVGHRQSQSSDCPSFWTLKLASYALFRLVSLFLLLVLFKQTSRLSRSYINTHSEEGQNSRLLNKSSFEPPSLWLWGWYRFIRPPHRTAPSIVWRKSGGTLISQSCHIVRRSSKKLYVEYNGESKDS